MKKIKDIVKNNLIVQALLINLLVMVAFLICFEPFWGIDDHGNALYLYGAYSGQYDPHPLYMNVRYGNILVFLLKKLPAVPWYGVMFYILTFVSLFLISYLLLKWNKEKLGYLLLLVLLLALGYEGYVAMQFTKMAGIAAGAGAYALFSKRSNVLCKIVGAMLFFFGFIIRAAVCRMVIGVWGLWCLAFLLYEFAVTRRIELDRILRLLIGMLVMIVIYSGTKYLPTFESDEDKAFWNEYWEWNAVRSALQDYRIPDYQEHKEEYEQLGISENDLRIWRSWNSDVDTLTLEKGRAIMAMQERSIPLGQRMMASKYIVGFFRDLVVTLPNTDMFITMAVMITFLLLSAGGRYKRKSVWMTIFSYVILLAPSYYLYIGGRYGIHRVDVGIYTSVILGLLLFVEDEHLEWNVDHKIYVLLVMVMLVIPYQANQDDLCSITEEQKQANRDFFEMTMGDTDHIYITGQKRGMTTSYNYFAGPFEVMPRGILSNRYSGYNVANKYRLAKRGIGNPYIEIVDNEDMYLVLADRNTDQVLWETYIGEHSGKQVKLVEVEHKYNRRFYYVKSK